MLEKILKHVGLNKIIYIKLACFLPDGFSSFLEVYMFQSQALKAVFCLNSPKVFK